MKILGIDPGYAIVGYGVVTYDNRKFCHIESGAVTTPAGMPIEKRLKAIYEQVTELIEAHRPEVLAIEELFFNSNHTTAVNVCQARGVVLLAAARHNVAVAEYTPLQVKQALVGYGRAEKHQVMEMTRRLLNLPAVPKPDDTADALAMAICHGQATGSVLRRSMLRQTGN